jgi:prepilin-type N-terminal cleavage/methylation domain-containing protein
MHSKKETWKRGFTLIEMLVVIAIFLVLFALLFPVIIGMRGVAYRAGCLNNLRQTAIVFHSFATDNNGNLPLSNATNPRLIRPDMHKAIERYFSGPYDIFYCPSPHAVTGPEWWDICLTWDSNHYKIGYVYVANLDQKNCSKFINGDPVTSILDPGASKGPILFDICLKRRDGNKVWANFPHDGIYKKAGINTLFGDLHAEWCNFETMLCEYHYIAPCDLWW